MAQMYYLYVKDIDDEEFHKYIDQPMYKSECNEIIQSNHYAALADLREFGIDTHSEFKIVAIN